MANPQAIVLKHRLETKFSLIADTVVDVTARGERKFTLHLPLVTCNPSIKVERLKTFFQESKA